MDKVLAVNSGSSSLKFKLFEMPSEAVIASGLIERIAIPGSQTTIKYGNGKVYKHQGTVKNHGEAVNNLMELLISLGIIEKYSEITGVGHRVVARCLFCRGFRYCISPNDAGRELFVQRSL